MNEEEWTNEEHKITLNNMENDYLVVFIIYLLLFIIIFSPFCIIILMYDDEWKLCMKD